jgi:hypothetical protein
MDIKEYRHPRMSTATDKSKLDENVHDPDSWTRVLQITLIFVLGVVLIFDIVDNNTTESKTIRPFSYHAYQNNSGALHGPFLGKVRFASSDLHVAPSLQDKMKQSVCEKDTVTAIDLQKCKMMRIPHVYLGKIHSSWSVLGAQSVFTLVKHIVFILIAFMIFSVVEEQIRLKGSKLQFRENFRFARSVTIVITVLLFTVDIALDLSNDMHELNEDHENKISIGSITTGFYFCVISIIFVCFSQLDDPEHAEKPAIVTASVEDAQAPAVAAPTVVPAQAFFKWPAVLQESNVEDENASNKRVHEIHGMLHTSQLLLVVFPLVLILALVKTKNLIVDVHLQLIFFSGIFFALLDIIETRVVTVLASLDTALDIKHPIGKIKFFVVLALFLAKLFVYVPTLQLTLVYYTKSEEIEWWLVVCPSLLFFFTCVLDFVYVSGLIAAQNTESWVVFIRKSLFFVYVGSLAGLLMY